jgi:hypothetical protein
MARHFRLADNDARVSPQARKRMADFIRAGHTLSQGKARFRVPPYVIRKACEEHGVEIKAGGKRFG